jgi:hypothetical protein
VIGSGPGVTPPDGGGAGFSGIVGRAPSEGGFGGGVDPAIGRTEGGGTPGADGGGLGAGGGGTNGLGGVVAGGGGPPSPAAAAPAVVVSFVVSFFGATPGGAAGLPGTLIRTVSLFWTGCSLFGGKVIRIVSLFVTSSGDSDGAGGISSAIERKSGERALSHPPLRVVNTLNRGNFHLPANFAAH